MSSRIAAIHQMAIRLCHKCRIPSVDADDVAATIVQCVRRRGKDAPAAAVTIVRRYLANRHNVRIKDIPTKMLHVAAISEYEAALERCSGGRPHDEWESVGDVSLPDGSPVWLNDRLEVRNFDMHSRRFAIENGVCPRCSLPGKFTEDSGRCQCGFAISSKHSHISPPDTNESKPARRKEPRMEMRGPDCYREANPRRLFPNFTHDPKPAQRKKPRMEMRGPH